MPSTVVARSRRRMSASLVDQLAPVLEVYDEIRSSWPVMVDEDAVRARLQSRLPALDVIGVLRGAGDLTHAARRAVTACEHAGLATSSDVYSLCRNQWNPGGLVMAWAVADTPPRGTNMVLARRVAAIVGGAILRRAADLVAPLVRADHRHGTDCPSCGGPPDLAIVRGTTRSAICARCDSEWKVETSGCLGCPATMAPDLVRVRSPFLGYSLIVCNSCGRYLKERTGSEPYRAIVERELTTQLDAAALERGFRI